MGLPSLLAIAMGCSAVDPNDDSEWTGETEQRRDPIVGGQATTGFPAVGTFIIPDGSKRCTGTVIAKRTVLTAAHCLKPYHRRPIKFMLGSSYSSPTAVIGVAALKAHPSYSPNHNDIGIVTLASDAPVTPMKILPSLDPSWLGKNLLFVGFGQSDGVAHSGQGIKRFVHMPIASISATSFRYAVPGKNTCRGDSGGPAFAQVGSELFVAGITSYGDEDCIEYGVDMRPDAYKAFIDANLTGGASTASSCNGETQVGRCDANTVVWCENSQVQKLDCSAKARVCGFSTTKQFFMCLEDPCKGETYAGRCDGKQLIWCDNQVVKTVSCANQCGLNSQQNYYDCL
jgi:hypothetical protein